MRRKRVGSHAVAAVVAAGCLALTTACGSSSGGGGGTSDGGAAQGVNGKVITIGSNAVLSGPASAYAAISAATQHYFDYLNSQGGVNGYTFKYIQHDNAYSGAQAITVARQLVNSDKVFAMVTAGSTPDSAVIPLAPSLKIPIIALNDGGLFPDHVVPNLYGIEPKFTQVTEGNARFALQNLHITDLAYAYEDDDFGQPGSKALPTYIPANGGKLLANVGFPAAESNFNPYANKLKASGAKAVLVGAGPTQLAGLQKAAAAIGYKPVWIAMFSGVTPAYLQLAGDAAEGTYFDSFVDSPQDTGPDMKLFDDTLAKYPDEIGLLGQLGWESGALIAEGVKEATANGATLTTSAFLDALNGLQGKRIAVWPDVTWSADSHFGATDEYIVQVQGKSFVSKTKPAPLPE